MGTEDQQQTPPADENTTTEIDMENVVPSQPDEQALALFNAQANERIRKVWHDGRWWYSVIDTVALLSGSDNPRRYWSDMKARIKDDSFVEMCAKCCPLKLPSPDRKLYETDCADFATLISLIHIVPALHRRADPTLSDQGSSSGKCGIYAIVNTVTHEKYIGSSSNIAVRFIRHKALLRRGKHHAPRLQKAWDTYGEEVFELVVLETLATIERLEEVEQQYIDEQRPVYNVAKVASNPLSLPPVSDERVQQVLFYLYEVQNSVTNTPLFRALREAIIYGLIKPGPKFAVLVQAEASGIDTWDGLCAFVQQHQQAC
ncbi:MAG TPA: GIY-YIG nuclease family protein [Ktedonobacterales bacterium]|nr:GIY-YIG nuclease family protein [Ktedonobacterales bacterium]